MDYRIVLNGKAVMFIADFNESIELVMEFHEDDVITTADHVYVIGPGFRQVRVEDAFDNGLAMRKYKGVEREKTPKRNA